MTKTVYLVIGVHVECKDSAADAAAETVGTYCNYRVSMQHDTGINVLDTAVIGCTDERPEV